MLPTIFSSKGKRRLIIISSPVIGEYRKKCCASDFYFKLLATILRAILSKHSVF